MVVLGALKERTSWDQRLARTRRQRVVCWKHIIISIDRVVVV